MIQNYKTILSSKTQLTDDVFLFRLNLTEPKEFSFIAGQYMMLAVPQASGQTVSRLYSIASSENEKQTFDLMVKIIPNGIAGQYLTGLKINDVVEFKGPAGVFTMRESSRSKLYLVTGTGLAPAWSMILSRSAKNNRQYLLWGLPYFKDVFFLDKIQSVLEQNSNLKVNICLSREENLDVVPVDCRQHFSIGRITNGLENLLNQGLKITDLDIYLCSGREIIDSLKLFLEQKGAQKEQVYFEKF